MMRLPIFLPAIALACAVPAQQFEKPVRIEAGGEPITTEIGHSAPYTCDWDGDGKRDLLVGQFGDGKLFVYINEGTNAEPVYAEGSLFEADGRAGTVPAS